MVGKGEREKGGKMISSPKLTIIIIQFVICFEFTIIVNLGHCVPGLVVAEK